jgi:Icc-related predicted phosphoesterase
MLKEAVLKKQPLLHLCGHIHEGYGVGKLEATTVINCAIVNYNNPVVFDVKFV